VGGKFAVELGKQRHAIGDAKLRAGGGERGIFRQRRAVDDEAVTRQRLEHRQERRIAHPVVRPGDAPAQRQHRVGIDRQHPVEARAQLAPSIGRGIVSKRLGSRYRSGRSKDWLKFKDPAAPAVKREAEEDWGRERWR
jgi:hypothetical protein